MELCTIEHTRRIAKLVKWSHSQTMLSFVEFVIAQPEVFQAPNPSKGQSIKQHTFKFSFTKHQFYYTHRPKGNSKMYILETVPVYNDLHI